MGINMGYKIGDLPRTENISGRLLRLPMYAELKITEVEYVAEQINLNL